MREGDNLDIVSKNANVQSGESKQDGVGAGNHGPSNMDGMSLEGKHGETRGFTFNNKQQLSNPTASDQGLSWTVKLFLAGVVVAGCVVFIRTRRNYTRGGRGVRSYA
jgi:hypothetical protein